MPDLPDDAGRITICSGEIPDGIIRFEGELTAEQVAMFRALWEAAANVTEPEGFRAWKAGVAHGRAAERGACAAIPQQMADHPGADMVLGMDEVRCALREAAWKIRNRGDSGSVRTPPDAL